MRWVVIISLCLNLLGPAQVWAQTIDKSPLTYSIRDYGVVLMTAILGGLVSWYSRVRKGELPQASVMVLIGELCTSAFAGLLAFWLCEWANAPQLLTAALVGISGHAGARSILWLERQAEKKLNVDSRLPK